MLEFLNCEFGSDSKLLHKFNSNITRSGEDVFFLYRWHCTQFPDALRPAFPEQILLLEEPLEDIEREFKYFWILFTSINGDVLLSHEFFSPIVNKLSHPKELDLVQENQLPPAYEWLPSTSHFLRSTWSRLRRRSPSPHLHLDEVDREENEFAAEKLESIQRIRTKELQNSYGKQHIEQLNNETLYQVSEFNLPAIDLKALEERIYLLKNSLESLGLTAQSLKKSESALEALILDFNSDDSTDSDYDEEPSEHEHETETVAENGEFCFPGFIGFEVVDAAHRKLIQFQQFDNSMHESCKLPLQWQLNDLYCLLAPVNRRTELIQKLAEAVRNREIAAKELQSAPPHRLQSKQSRLDEICAEIADLKQRIGILDANLLTQLSEWFTLSTELLFAELDKFKQ